MRIIKDMIHCNAKERNVLLNYGKLLNILGVEMCVMYRSSDYSKFDSHVLTRLNEPLREVNMRKERNYRKEHV